MFYAMSLFLVTTFSPTVQYDVGRNSEIKKISEAEVSLVTGRSRYLVKSDFKVEVKGLGFSSKNGDFEIRKEKNYVDLDVYQGEVEVTSPDLHSFVPYIVKKNQGLRVMNDRKTFIKKRFGPKMKDTKWIKDKKPK